jgi:hypothetical protein
MARKVRSRNSGPTRMMGAPGGKKPSEPMGNMSPTAPIGDKKLVELLLAIGRIYKLQGSIVSFGATTVTWCPR